MKIRLLSSICAVLISSVLSSAQDNLNPSFNRKPAGNVEVGALFNDGFAGEFANVSTGYNVLPGLFAGVGIGIKDQRFNTALKTKSIFVPTFVHLRYSPLNKKFSPFIDLKGGLVSDFTKSVKTDLPDSYPGTGCGHFFRITLGIDYKNYFLSIGDDWSNLTYDNSASNDYGWVISIGYRF